MPKCTVCGYEGTHEKDSYGNYILYRNGEPICRACEEDYDIYLEAGLSPSSLKDLETTPAELQNLGTGETGGCGCC